MKKHLGKISILVVIAVFAGAFWYAGQAGERANEGVVLEPNVKGNPDAEVVLVKHSDFQCPACAAAAPVVDSILETYGDQVRFEYKHFPLVSIHPLAIPAARATEAAGQQGEFFAMHDLLFENQQAWSSAPNPTAIFISYAEQIGLDVPTFRRHMSASLIDDHVQAEFNVARELGLSSTPTFFLNGEQLTFQTYEELISQVEAAVLGDQAPTTEAVEADVTAEEQIDLEFGI